MPVEKGQLKPQDAERIRKNIVYLTEELSAEHVSLILYQENVFTLDDYEEIRSKPTRIKKVQAMLDMLMNSGPNEAYSKFINALETQGFVHVIAKLNDTVTRELL